jgi:adenylosuccinate lyase
MSENLLNLSALSPLDGRYRRDVAALEAYFSEAALLNYRVRVEIEYVIFLARTDRVAFVRPFTAQQRAALRAIYTQFTLDDAQQIVDWDRRVNHDVKAVEYWLRDRFEGLGLNEWGEAIHFALTSEDVNNLAYALMVRDGRDQVLVPTLNDICTHLREWAFAEAETTMLSRTHGQPATPTTMGKELAVFASRLERALDDVRAITLTGKLNGATGTFAAHVAAFPELDWLTFSRAFVRSLGLEPLVLTTQIEPHDTLAMVCDALKRINTVLLDVCQDMWRYISDDYLVQMPAEGEVGSSTMPHKVNPIDFENGEGNLGVANALLEFFSRKLPVSRLQRDLSDSTVLRNLGCAFGHSQLAYRRLFKGLKKLTVNHTRLLEDVHRHPEVIAEAIQTILRRTGYPQPYEVLKTMSRGRTLTHENIHAFIDTLDVHEAVKSELHALLPETYTGLAANLAKLPISKG